MNEELDPAKTRDHGLEIYANAVQAYARTSRSLVTVIDTVVENLRSAAAGFADLVATLEVQHRQLDDVAEQLNPALAASGMPRLGPTPDHMGTAIDTLPPGVRDAVRTAHLSPWQVLRALVDAAESGV